MTPTTATPPTPLHAFHFSQKPALRVLPVNTNCLSARPAVENYINVHMLPQYHISIT